MTYFSMAGMDFYKLLLQSFLNLLRYDFPNIDRP